MSKQLQLRSLDLQIKEQAQESQDKMTVAGYFAVFNQETKVFDGVVEQIQKGAFLKSLFENDIKVLVEHDESKLLARTGNQSARMVEDDYGLYVEVDLPNTTLGRDTYELVKNKTLHQCSIGFFVDKVEHSLKNGKEYFKILEANLLEVSFVTFPAYDGTSVEARNRNESTLQLEKIKERKLKCLESI